MKSPPFCAIINLLDYDTWKGAFFMGRKNPAKNINIGLLAHVDAGKTTLSEALLYATGQIRINETLPPFVNLGKLGLNYGLQAAQFTATSTTAESQTLSNPMYVHSIPNNNDNQDIVSMGTNAAMLTRQVVENGYQVAAIEMLALVQAADYLQCAGELSDATRQLYADIRGIVPRFADDTPKHREIAAIENFLKNNSASL